MENEKKAKRVIRACSPTTGAIVAEFEIPDSVNVFDLKNVVITVNGVPKTFILSIV